MPLSEHEQRILHELEQSLYQEDPDFAERVRSETVYRHAGRYCIWSALVFVAALVFMFFTFSRSVVLGFVGVVVMFLSGVVFANNARRMGKAGHRRHLPLARTAATRATPSTIHATGSVAASTATTDPR